MKILLQENPAHKAAKHLHPTVYYHLTSLGARGDLENIEVRATHCVVHGTTRLISLIFVGKDDTALSLLTYNTRYNF
ncbi:hypothetical protein PHMEG_00031103 [Phytophthora megakarya]|uniref:Uncharacterized protein n=1 Tax=Phytophthora megakarya TaxID=4795 RepID=A0A225UZG9_9STRA|nr:hypothetical protein PHMEG_00031103 [Phytophthora megakarya]